MRISLVIVLIFTTPLCSLASSAAHAIPLPEPGQLALLGGGLFGLAALIRRRLSD